MKGKMFLGLIVLLVTMLSGVVAASASSATASLTDARAYTTSSSACADFSLHVSGELNKDVRVSVFPKYSVTKGDIANTSYSKGTNVTPSGNLTAQEVLTPTYENSRFDNLSYCINLNYFPISSYDYDYYFEVQIAEEATDNLIDYFTFDPLTHKGLGSTQGLRIQNTVVDAQSDGVEISFSLYIYGYAGATLDANVYPKYASTGEQLRTKSSTYGTPSGYLVGFDELVVPKDYKVAMWRQGSNPVKLFIPYTAFPKPTNTTGYDVAFDIQIFDGSDVAISLDLSDAASIINIHKGSST